MNAEDIRKQAEEQKRQQQEYYQRIKDSTRAAINPKLDKSEPYFEVLIECSCDAKYITEINTEQFSGILSALDTCDYIFCPVCNKVPKFRYSVRMHSGMVFNAMHINGRHNSS